MPAGLVYRKGGPSRVTTRQYAPLPCSRFSIRRMYGLANADLHKAGLLEPQLEGADPRSANFGHAALVGADLSDAMPGRCEYEASSAGEGCASLRNFIHRLVGNGGEELRRGLHAIGSPSKWAACSPTSRSAEARAATITSIRREKLSMSGRVKCPLLHALSRKCNRQAHRLQSLRRRCVRVNRPAMPGINTTVLAHRIFQRRLERNGYEVVTSCNHCNQVDHDQ